MNWVGGRRARLKQRLQETTRHRGWRDDVSYYSRPTAHQKQSSRTSSQQSALMQSGSVSNDIHLFQLLQSGEPSSAQREHSKYTNSSQHLHGAPQFPPTPTTSVRRCERKQQVFEWPMPSNPRLTTLVFEESADCPLQPRQQQASDKAVPQQRGEPLECRAASFVVTPLKQACTEKAHRARMQVVNNFSTPGIAIPLTEQQSPHTREEPFAVAEEPQSQTMQEAEVEHSNVQQSQFTPIKEPRPQTSRQTVSQRCVSKPMQGDASPRVEMARGGGWVEVEDADKENAAWCSFLGTCTF
eukprot:m.163508 g.163508  ORF g.163508 m.163508 type:complete len:298 (-) comp14389_c0_seq1:1243-2136(-)